jgi:hypothetical protein
MSDTQTARRMRSMTERLTASRRDIYVGRDATLTWEAVNILQLVGEAAGFDRK